MTEERDPLLEQLFAKANQDLDGEAFVATVMARADRLRARRRIVMLAICLAAIPAIWLVAEPVNDGLGSLVQFITEPIVEADAGLASPILTPVNNIAGALALGLLGLRAILRRLFS